MHYFLIAAALVALTLPGVAAAHGGGLAADGCHNDRRNGGRHCHRAPSAPAPRAERPQRLSGPSRAFPNCSAARAAGAAPVRRGDPGYGQHLDRDNDGIGCE
ncbi:excalibur calcium-binding domain-containing protein [Sphingopyxis indica]|uniref:excalibur calcium-binding domain-containing protein n=1 Tax=Sphingopyxis indica TaxID=436663 RepID=UPI0029391B9A|nr:excalibur calcium-binding domain-containing protein [Sphingopyxis indica]WOF41723.1 excalibur calcium-binding domain-containing protein [Sphingopyxis indica]